MREAAAHADSPSTPVLHPPRQPAHIITTEQEALTIAEQLAERLHVHAALRDSQRQLPWAELDEIAASGLLALRVPKQWGGVGVSNLNLTRIIATISAADASIGQLFLSIVLACGLIESAATDAQKRLFFGKILEGYRWGNGHAEGGPMPAGTTQTRITRVGDHYRVDGAKAYSTGALFSHLISIGCVNEDGEARTAVIDRYAPGLTILDDWDGFGQRTTASGTLLLDNVKVQASHVIDSEKGRLASNTYAIPDLFHSALDLGIAKAAFSDTLHYVREHARPFARTGVNRIEDDPYVLQIIGDVRTRIVAGEAVLERAASLFDRVTAAGGEGRSEEVSAALAEAKILTTEAALLASNKLFQLGGASSTRLIHGYDRHWRNARTHTVHDPVAWKFHLIGSFQLKQAGG